MPRPTRNSAKTSRLKDVIEQLAPKRRASKSSGKGEARSSKKAQVAPDATDSTAAPTRKRGRPRKSNAPTSEQDGVAELAGGEKTSGGGLQIEVNLALFFFRSSSRWYLSDFCTHSQGHAPA